MRECVPHPPYHIVRRVPWETWVDLLRPRACREEGGEFQSARGTKAGLEVLYCTGCRLMMFLSLDMGLLQPAAVSGTGRCMTPVCGCSGSISYIVVQLRLQNCSPFSFLSGVFCDRRLSYCTSSPVVNDRNAMDP